MTDDIQFEQRDPNRWRLVLDEGEGLEVWRHPTEGANPEGPDMLLWLPVRRAQDLSRVLDAYSRMAAIFDEVSQVSATEESLARGLHDAAALATDRRPAPAQPVKIHDGDRLRAMGIIQEARPGISHSALVSIVDAAVGWVEEDMDHKAVDLLNAVVGDGAGSRAYFTLLGRPTPPGLVMPADAASS